MKAQVLSRTWLRLHTCARVGINEEMAFAFSNKKFIRFESKRTGDINVYTSKASDGQDIQINIDAKDASNIISIYQINIK